MEIQRKENKALFSRLYAGTEFRYLAANEVITSVHIITRQLIIGRVKYTQKEPEALTARQ